MKKNQDQINTRQLQVKTTEVYSLFANISMGRIVFTSSTSSWLENQQIKAALLQLNKMS